MSCDKSYTTWIVVEPKSTRYDPRCASVLCVVWVLNDEYEAFTNVLQKYSLNAFKDSLGHWFQDKTWTICKPIGVQKFVSILNQCNKPEYDFYGFVRAFDGVRRNGGK